MSLLDELKESCILLEKTVERDGFGGYTTVWRDGVEFDAIFRFDNSTAGRVAGVQGVTSLYTITVSKSFPLAKFDVLRRVSNGKVYRITSDGTDNRTPPSASLDMKQYAAEEWALTS